MELNRESTRAVLEDLGVEVRSSTSYNWLCLCPFHANTDTPALSVAQKSGLWMCFNRSCGKSGNIEQLVMLLSDRNYTEAMLYLTRFEPTYEPGQRMVDAIREMFDTEPEYPMFPQMVVDRTVEVFWDKELGKDARDYMLGRRFTAETLRFFQIGLSIRQGDLITYPVHTPTGDNVVGLVGRGVYQKVFKNSTGIPRSRVVFNIHNARKMSDTAIVTESGFDAMMIHQAGHRSAVATMGSSVSDRQIELLDRNFSKIIVFSDNDDAGEEMYERIYEKSTRPVLRPYYEHGTIYPAEGINRSRPKDACDLSAYQITTMIKQANNDQWI